jgi:predicted dehydrogenase
MGPITEVVAVGTKARATRVVQVGPRAGAEFPVDVPTHVAVTSMFADGATASSVMSVDTPKFSHGVFEINGTEGTVVLGAPNWYGEMPIKVYRRWTEFPLTMEQEFETLPEQGPMSGRGIGVVTMARTLRVMTSTSLPDTLAITSSTPWSPSRNPLSDANSSR